MDPITQGALGANFSQCFANKKERIKMATICGMLGGMAPDMDVFIRSSTDPLLALEYHRHFTHSLFFIPFGGLLTAILIFLLLFRDKIKDFPLIYFFTTLGFATHGLLDSCTSYGTYLYWPFSNERVTWNIISIIDPIYTIILTTGLIICNKKKSINLARIFFTFSMFYMSYCYYMSSKAENFVKELANSRGHIATRVFLNPTIGNNILWRAIYEHDGYYYVDAIRVSVFNDTKYFEGLSVPVIDKTEIYPELKEGSTQRNDLYRFAFFAKDYIYFHPDYNNVVADLRYGLMPNNDKAIWGIEIDVNNPNAHVTYRRLALGRLKSRFSENIMEMLFGNSN